MENDFHSLNAMRNMEIIDIETGSKVGFIKDFKINCEENKVTALILPGEIKSWFAKEDEKEIPWSNIVKIGRDVILVRFQEKIDTITSNM